MRLMKEQAEKEAANEKRQTKMKNQLTKFHLKKPKSISSNNSIVHSNINNVRKKVDNVNTDFIKHIEERKTLQSNKNDE